MNIITATDSYKLTHYPMYPDNTERVYSYMESRGGEFPSTVFFGLQYLLKEYLSGQVVTKEKIDEAERISRYHFGSNDIFNREGWEHILEKHDGKLPVTIKAVPEGTVVPNSNVLMTIENTDNQVPWLTNHLETLLMQLWYPITISTICYHMKRELFGYAVSSGDPAGIEYMLHNFGYRGSSSQESAAINGGAHLTCFAGTDNIAGMEFAEKYYEGFMPGRSVPAAEHSTITSWGRNGETKAYKNILDKFPTGIVSIVSDSYDIKNACENIWGETLRQQIIDNPERKVVIRPDSGDPLESIKSCLNILGSKFGYSTNKKGYKVLPDYLRILQGDGISYKTLPIIMKGVIKSGWSINNVVFGSGGGLIQECTRDTQKFAIKCSWASINGESVDVYKEPKSDYSKSSKRGRLKLVKEGEYKTVSENADGNDTLIETFRDGQILSTCTFEDIRCKIDKHL